MKKKIELGCYYVMINDNKLEIYNDDEILVCLRKKSNENFTDKDIGQYLLNKRLFGRSKYLIIYDEKD